MSEPPIDYDRMAEGLDTVVPLWQPVADRLIERTTGLAPGAFVLDVASGTGEPGLTLVERHPGVRLLGVDTSEVFVGIARRKAVRRGLDGIEYAVMNAQRLDLPDDSVDVVVSRFGLLSFADPQADAREAARVLRPGGTLSIATWDEGRTNTITYAAMAAAADQLPPPVVAMAGRLDQHATPGRRESWLAEAGLADVTTELFAWHVEFPDDDALWRLVSGPAMFGAVLGEIDETIRMRFGELMAEHRRPDGFYRIPFACRMLSATKPTAEQTAF